MQENHSDAGANTVTFLTYFGIMSLLSSFSVLATCLFCCAGFYPCRHPEELRALANPEPQPNNALARPLFNAQPNNGLVEIDIQGLGGDEPRGLRLNRDALDQFIINMTQNTEALNRHGVQRDPEIISQIMAGVTQGINEGGLNEGGLLDDIANMQDRPNAQRVTIENASETHPAVVASVICAICLDQITAEQEQVENANKIATLDTCGHQYHRQCLVLWDQIKNSRADCPKCRKPFTLTPQV